MSKDILMIVHTMGTLAPSDNDRFTYLARRILELDSSADIEIVTSDYEHHKKRYRDKSIANQHPYKITFLHEKQYKKNVSIARIVGHLSFAARLKKYLNERKKPDVIYCAVPPLYSADVAARYAKKNSIKFIIDVQDLWPESFKMALGNNVLADVALTPLLIKANSVYSKADVIYAVSDTFVNRAKASNKKDVDAKSIFLGTDSILVDSALNNAKSINKENEFWIGYVGNIGVSYDFDNVMEALRIVKQSGRDNIVFHVIGDGNMRNHLESIAKEKYPNTVIHGYIPYEDMLSILKQCDVAINPIVKKSVSSVVNKVGDYAAAGIATINTQNSDEYRNLLSKYNAGISTIPEDANSIADAIAKLYDDNDLRCTLGQNNRRMYEELFDRRTTYNHIIDNLLK